MKNFSDSESDGNKPPGRRVVKRVDPFSPWQLLIESRRVELNISFRALTKKIAAAGRAYEHTTVFSWLRSPEGTPPGGVYTPELNDVIAGAISVTPGVLAAAFEESRRKFTLSTAVASQQGPLSVLRTLFSGSQKTTWTREEIVKLIDDVRGC